MERNLNILFLSLECGTLNLFIFCIELNKFIDMTYFVFSCHCKPVHLCLLFFIVCKSIIYLFWHIFCFAIACQKMAILSIFSF